MIEPVEWFDWIPFLIGPVSLVVFVMYYVLVELIKKSKHKGKMR